jgi:hypothetical protein
MKGEHTHQKKLPFAAAKDRAAFQREIILSLIEEVDQLRTKDISPNNVYTFQHGRKWDFQQQSKEGYRPQSGELELTSSTTTIELQRVLPQNNQETPLPFLRAA